MSTRTGWSWFLGPYANHYRELGKPIRDTVRDAQNLLARRGLTKRLQEHRDYAEKALKSVSHCRDMSPPQTLGELCLEVVSDHIRPYDARAYQQDYANAMWFRSRSLAIRRALFMRPENHKTGHLIGDNQ